MKPKCSDCGKTITYDSQRCRSCHSVHFGKSQVGENNPHYKHGKPKCLQCGKTVKQYRNKFCSRKCSGMAESGKKHHNWQDKLKEKVCPICGSIFKTYTNDYCSDECGRKSRVGDRSPNWMGGLSYQDYNVEFNSQLRQKVRDRDNHKCQVCGVPEVECLERLSVHHIDYNKKNSIMDNLISVCHDCHIKTNTKREYWKQYFQSKVVL